MQSLAIITINYKCSAQETEYQVTPGHPDPTSAHAIYLPTHNRAEVDHRLSFDLGYNQSRAAPYAVFGLKCADLSDFNV